MDEILLKEYYEKRFAGTSPPHTEYVFPPFEELCERKKDVIRKSIGFAFWQLGYRMNELKQAVIKQMTPILRFLGIIKK